MKTFLGRTTLALTLILAACSAPESDSASSEGANAVTAIDPASPEGIVRRYYGAANSANPASDLEAIADDNVVLEAPSVYLLNPLGGTDQVHGKAAFVKAVSGAAFLLKGAKIAAPGATNDPQSGVAFSVLTPSGAPRALVMSRLQLPLPNGDLLTQVEFFEIDGGKIVHLQSYYDGARFAKALPALAIVELKASLGI